jgi:3-mercaptopyruvate sulfurtransferase SseA
MPNKTSRPRASIFLLVAGVILIAGAILSSLFFSRNARPTPAAESSGENDPADFPRVDLEEAKAAYDSGTALFVDVRPVESYAESHIPGALSIPLGELEARQDELDRAAWIITYCT